MAWLLRDSVIDALELDDDLVAFAIEMAGERAVSVTDDRKNIMFAAAVEIEGYLDRMYFRGPGGAARSCTSVVDVAAAGDVPVIPELPRTAPVNVTHVLRWSDEAGAFQTASYQARPLGVIRVERGVYQIVVSATPSLSYPISVREAVARLFSFRESFKPRRDTIELADGTTPTVAGAVMKSGAAEVVRHIRRGGG